MRLLLAPDGWHIGSKALLIRSKSPEGRHSAAVLVSAVPLGIYFYSSGSYYRYAAPLGLSEYGFV